MARVRSLRSPTLTLSDAVAAYWSSGAQRHLALNTQRAYRHAHHALLDTLGPDQPITVLSGAALREVLEERWAGASQASWNAQVTALRSLITYSQRHGWLTETSASLEPRRQSGGGTRAIPSDDLAALWARPDISLRDRTLWRMLYDTAARADEVLALDVEDLDFSAQRAAAPGRAGHQTIVWGRDTADLLGRHLAGRRRGPLFLTHRRPNVLPADLDRLSPTGRARLSYHRAWVIFHQVSGGWTLHQLRQSAIAHLGEGGV